jgi:hypothetical protein
MQEIITATIQGDFRTWTVRLFQTGADYTAIDLGVDALPIVASAEPELLLEYGDRKARVETPPLLPSSIRASLRDEDSELFAVLSKIEAERGAGVFRMQVEAPAAYGPRASTWHADPVTGAPGMDGPYRWRGYARLDTSEAALFPDIDGESVRLSAGCGIAEAEDLPATLTEDYGERTGKPGDVPTVYEVLRLALADEGAGDSLPLRYLAPIRPAAGIVGDTLSNLRYRPLFSFDNSGPAGIYADVWRAPGGDPIDRRKQLAELATLQIGRIFQSFEAIDNAGEVRPAWHLAPRAIAGEQLDPSSESYKIAGLGSYWSLADTLPAAPITQAYAAPAYAIGAADLRANGARRTIRARPIRLQRKPRRKEPGLSADPYFSLWTAGGSVLNWSDVGVTSAVQRSGVESLYSCDLAADSILEGYTAYLGKGTQMQGYIRAYALRNGASDDAAEFPLRVRLRLVADGPTEYGLDRIDRDIGVGGTTLLSLPVAARWVEVSALTNELELVLRPINDDRVRSDGSECRTTPSEYGKKVGDVLAPALPASGFFKLQIRPNSGFSGAKAIVDSVELVLTSDLGITYPDGGEKPIVIETGLVAVGELEIEVNDDSLGWTPRRFWSTGHATASEPDLDELLAREHYDARASSAAAGPVFAGTIDGLLPPNAGALVDLDSIPGTESGQVRYGVEGSARYNLVAETSELQLVPAGDSVVGATPIP